MERPRAPQDFDCPSGKMSFSSHVQAKAYAHNAKRSDLALEIYKCSLCGEFHLRSKKSGAEKRHMKKRSRFRLEKQRMKERQSERNIRKFRAAAVVVKRRMAHRPAREARADDLATRLAIEVLGNTGKED